MLIADNLTCHPRPAFVDPATATPESILDSFVHTTETSGICSRIVQRLADFPDPQFRPLLFAGAPGTGKTHILRYIAGLLERPLDPAWTKLTPKIPEGARPEKPLRSLFVTVPSDPEIDLGRQLISTVSVDPALQSSTMEVPFEEFAPLVLGLAQSLASGETALVILEGVSQRIGHISGDEKLQRELRLYKMLMEGLAGFGVLAVLVGDERHLRPEPGEAQSANPLAALSESCDFVWLSRNNIVEIYTTALATRDSRQRERIREVLDRLQKKLPSFGPVTESSVDLYPIHPHVFNALFQLRSALPGFSPLRFLQEEIPLVLARPEEQLVTPDCLFDYITPRLRGLERFSHLLAAYESFRTTVLPRFKSIVRDKVESLLKAIAFATVSDAGPVDVKTLADSLLLYEDSDYLPRYSSASSLLMEMEQKGGIYLIAEGEKLKRSYRLLDLINPPILTATRERLEGAEEFRRRLPLLLYDWIHSEIPSWKPDLSSKYERSSQSLVVQLPEGETRPVGLVCFKSEHDPFWSQEDFQVLEESQYSWLLLVLSPLERAFESNAALREFAACSKRILIWRPDRPTLHEVGRLQELVSHHPALGPASAFETSAVAREQTRRILRAMYVERGQFITAEDQWFIGGEIESHRVSRHLSVHLSALAVPASEPAAVESSRSRPEQATASADEKEALRIAATLTGMQELQSREVVRDRMLEWWNAVLETEAAVLSPKARSLPDSLMTTNFWREVKPTRNRLQMVKPVMESLRSGEASLAAAVGEILGAFGGNEGQLLEWRDALRNLAGLIRWLPGYEHTKDYLVGAFPLGHDILDGQRACLLGLIAEPHRFIQPSAREKYDLEFLEFKKGYIDCYQSAHEEALNIVSASKEAERKVDAKALQNLELLSNLLYTDKSYLNRVRILGKWILHNQCLLPVREILERYPRCYCNFNPAGNRELAESAAQINTLIQEGIEYFRDALRKCSLMIIEDLKILKVDEFHTKQIAAVLSHGPLTSLKPRTVEIINKIIEKHSSDFLIALRG